MPEKKHITQIISLPRSRTAWLSVALTMGDCFAFHDGSNPPITNAEDYLQRLNSPTQRNAVDVSSALVLRHDLVSAANCPIIIIERDVDEARESFCKHIGDVRKVNGIWDLIVEGFDSLKKKFSSRIVMNIGFADLAKNEVIEAIFREVSPYGGNVETRFEFFNRPRIELLQNLNIQERKPIWAGA